MMCKSKYESKLILILLNSIIKRQSLYEKESIQFNYLFIVLLVANECHKHYTFSFLSN